MTRSLRANGWVRYLALQAATAAASFALVWAWIAVAPMAYLDPEYPVWRAKLAMLQRCDLGQVLIVGDSRAAVDVMPALLPVPATNLAVGGGMPIEAYLAVARALACPVPPRRVVISLDAAHFVRARPVLGAQVKFGFVGPADLALLRRLERETGDASLAEPEAARRPSRLRCAAGCTPGGFRRCISAAWPRAVCSCGCGATRQRLPHTLAARGQYFFGRDDGSSTVASEGHMTAFIPLPVLDRYFDRMLALLAARNIPADFVAMPMNQATDRAVRPGSAHRLRRLSRALRGAVSELPRGGAADARLAGSLFRRRILAPQPARRRFAECPVRQMRAGTAVGPRRCGRLRCENDRMIIKPDGVYGVG